MKSKVGGSNPVGLRSEPAIAEHGRRIATLAINLLCPPIHFPKVESGCQVAENAPNVVLCFHAASIPGMCLSLFLAGQQGVESSWQIRKYGSMRRGRLPRIPLVACCAVPAITTSWLT